MFLFVIILENFSVTTKIGKIFLKHLFFFLNCVHFITKTIVIVEKRLIFSFFNNIKIKIVVVENSESRLHLKIIIFFKQDSSKSTILNKIINQLTISNYTRITQLLFNISLICLQFFFLLPNFCWP